MSENDEKTHDVQYANCPNCGILIDLFEKNCRIIRCGGTVDALGRFTQFPPHAKKAQVDALIAAATAHYGCGVPLKLVDSDRTFILTTWDS